eukprot:CAMPEP_0174883002 /NCGR_PEP_ID=MMETSP1114-20130205/85049_1 /TAXON_ID=312471 /ORGANISM="Neobodo designis, Strain CCAP 1951/1" /LENGTH=124 /DNA_ID=CAMNT_0016118403 /DNA_START=610 /DNA_END=985 /DNA_ORIENTATION=-
MNAFITAPGEWKPLTCCARAAGPPPPSVAPAARAAAAVGEASCAAAGRAAAYRGARAATPRPRSRTTCQVAVCGKVTRSGCAKRGSSEVAHGVGRGEGPRRASAASRPHAAARLEDRCAEDARS